MKTYEELQDRVEALEDALHSLNNHFTAMQLLVENYLKPEDEAGMKNRDVFIGSMLLCLDGPTQCQRQQQVQDLLQDVRVIDLEKESWKQIKQAAEESGWMPDDYCMNDWVSDLCRYLKEGLVLGTQIDSRDTFYGCD